MGSVVPFKPCLTGNEARPGQLAPMGAEPMLTERARSIEDLRVSFTRDVKTIESIILRSEDPDLREYLLRHLESIHQQLAFVSRLLPRVTVTHKQDAEPSH
jgi:hypothetical protein